MKVIIIVLCLISVKMIMGAYGFSEVEGRWVQAEIKIINTNDSVWSPKSNAKEFRFVPLSMIDTRVVTDPRYTNCVDSLRVYDYKTDSLLYNFTYDYEAAKLDPDSIYFYFEFIKILNIKVPGSPRNLILTYTGTGEKDTLVEIKPFNTWVFGES